MLNCCCFANSCLPSDPDAREADSEEEFTQIRLSASVENHDEINNELQYSHCTSLQHHHLSSEQLENQSNERLEQSHISSLSNRDCLQPYRFHRCKFHHKKNRLQTTGPPPLDTANDIEHSIVVVANLPVDNFEKLQEDVV